MEDQWFKSKKAMEVAGATKTLTYDGRLAAVEAALRDLQQRELDREDGDDEEIRLESELNNNAVDEALLNSISAMYDMMKSIISVSSISDYIIESTPDNKEPIDFYTSAEDMLYRIIPPLLDVKVSLGNFIAMNPDHFPYTVDEDDE